MTGPDLVFAQHRDAGQRTADTRGRGQWCADVSARESTPLQAHYDARLEGSSELSAGDAAGVQVAREGDVAEVTELHLWRVPSRPLVSAGSNRFGGLFLCMAPIEEKWATRR